MNVIESLIKFFVAVFKSPQVKKVAEVAVDVIEDAAVDYLKDKAVKELKRHDIDIEDTKTSKPYTAGSVAVDLKIKE